MAEGHGLQDAEKGCAFISLPPVLHLHLKVCICVLSVCLTLCVLCVCLCVYDLCVFVCFV